jgi:hypothetical protein
MLEGMEKGSKQSGGQGPLGVVLAALVGLGGGALAGGLLLMLYGYRALKGQISCGDLSDMECNFMRQSAAEVGQAQFMGGALLVLLSIGIILLLRSRLRAPSP